MLLQNCLDYKFSNIRGKSYERIQHGALRSEKNTSIYPDQVSACAPELAAKIGEVDAIVTAEAKGIALAYEVSKELGHKEFIVARKSTKSYMKDVVSASVHSITTAGEQHLYLDGKDADKIRGKRVCLLDDVISTGESLHALECLMANASEEVVKKAAILAEGDAADRKDIVFLQKLPLFKKTGDGEYEVIE